MFFLAVDPQSLLPKKNGVTIFWLDFLFFFITKTKHSYYLKGCHYGVTSRTIFHLFVGYSLCYCLIYQVVPPALESSYISRTFLSFELVNNILIFTQNIDYYKVIIFGLFLCVFSYHQ